MAYGEARALGRGFQTQYVLDVGSWIFIVIALLSFSFIAVVAVNYKNTNIATMGTISVILLIAGLALGRYRYSYSFDIKNYLKVFDAFVIALIGSVIAQFAVIFGHKAFHMALFGYLTVLMAVSEEVFFRGFLQGTIEAFSGPWIAIPVSSLVWTLYHWGVYGQTPYVLPAIFVSGLFLGYAVYKSQSLFPAILAHSIINLLATLQWRGDKRWMGRK